MRRIASLLFCAILLFSCDEEKKNPTYTLTGRLMADCGVPAANVHLTLKQEATFTGGGVVATAVTDANGYFTFEYKNENGQTLKINTSGSIIENIPSKKNLELGDVYTASGKTNILISLDVLNPYTSLDTLYFTNFDFANTSGPIQKMAGPFQSGLLMTIEDVPYIKKVIYGVGTSLGITYYVNNPNLHSMVEFPVTLCNGSYADAILTIE